MLDQIEKLLTEHRKIWFFVKDEEKELFVKCMDQIGASFWDGSSLSRENCQKFIALDQDKKLTYVSGMAWVASEHKGNGSEGIYHGFDTIKRVLFGDLVR